MLYFAYGSNMDWEQMRSRCPSAQFIAVASLPSYRLAFLRFSRNRCCDVASIAAAEGETVWGAVYEIDDTDRSALDACEGFRPGRDRHLNSYEPAEITVLREGNPKEPIEVITYIARPQPGFVPRGPNEAYSDLIVRGARYWQLPEQYCHFLASHASEPFKGGG